jgi:hypothetical protein
VSIGVIVRSTTVRANVCLSVKLKCSSGCGISTDVSMLCVQMRGSWIRGDIVQSFHSAVIDRYVARSSYLAIGGPTSKSEDTKSI